MKRVKLILASAVVVVTVTGALAFKAFNPATVYCNNASNKCQKLVQFQTADNTATPSTNPCGEGGTTRHFSTAGSLTTSCPTTTATVYAVND